LNDLVEALQTMDLKEGPIAMPVTTETEIGVLTESFNEMSQRIHAAREDLKSKIAELEAANREIRDTQARLVHTAKMASLGQLVAGVAHELNNPNRLRLFQHGHSSRLCRKTPLGHSRPPPRVPLPPKK
jgi:two-component system NtrC family sensor kinase